MAPMLKVQTGRECEQTLATIRQYRLVHDLTYRALAEQIGIGHSRLFGLLNGLSPRLNDRTLYRLEAFVERVSSTEQVAS